MRCLTQDPSHCVWAGNARGENHIKTAGADLDLVADHHAEADASGP